MPEFGLFSFSGGSHVTPDHSLDSHCLAGHEKCRGPMRRVSRRLTTSIAERGTVQLLPKAALDRR